MSGSPFFAPDFRKAMAFAEYITPRGAAGNHQLRRGADSRAGSLSPDARAAADRIYRFITEMQDRIHISLMRDIRAAAFTPDQISLAYPKPGLAWQRTGSDVV